MGAERGKGDKQQEFYVRNMGVILLLGQKITFTEQKQISLIPGGVILHNMLCYLVNYLISLSGVSVNVLPTATQHAAIYLPIKVNFYSHWVKSAGATILFCQE